MITTWLDRQRPTWARMKAENDAGYQRVIEKTDAPPASVYKSIGRWEWLRYQIDGDPVWAQKAFAGLKKHYDDFHTVVTGNESREDTIELAMMYHVLKDALSTDDLVPFETYLHAVAKGICAKQRLGDSDQLIGNYFGLRLIDQVLSTVYLAGNFFNEDLGIWQPWSVAEVKIRHIVSKMSAGGNLPESSEYNQGTAWLLYVGAYWTGWDEWPEVQQFLRDHARLQLFELTPDLKDSFQWGDVESDRMHRLELKHARPDLWAVMSYLLEPTDPLLAAKVRRLERDVYAANGMSGPQPMYARYSYFADPYGDEAEWREDGYHVAPGTGHVYWRFGQQAGMFHAPNWRHGGVDHNESWGMGDLRVWQDGKWVVDHELGYVTPPDWINQVVVNGLRPSFEVGGLLNVHLESGKYLAISGTNAGITRDAEEGKSPHGDAAQLYTFLHENTRTVIVLLNSPAIIVADRVHADDVKTLVQTTQWGTFTWKDIPQYQWSLAQILSFPVVYHPWKGDFGAGFHLFLTVLGDVSHAIVGDTVTVGAHTFTFNDQPGPKLQTTLKDGLIVYDRTKWDVLKAIGPLWTAAGGITPIPIPTPTPTPVPKPTPTGPTLADVMTVLTEIRTTLAEVQREQKRVREGRL